MKITENSDFSLLTKIGDHLLRVVDCGMQDFGRLFPSSIQITPSQWASIITVDDAIWVQHWHNFENEILPQDFRLHICWICQEVQCALHHPWAHRFSRVNSGCQDNPLTLMHVLRVHPTSNCQILAFIPCKCFTEDFPLDKRRFSGIIRDLVQLLNLVCIGIRITISEVNCVPIILIVISECMSVVTSFLTPEQTIIVVGDICAASMPAYISLLCCFLTVYQNLHSLIVQTIRFAEVEHGEADFTPHHVRGPKEKPLCMPWCIHIILQQKQIFLWVYFKSCCQIARFKSWFKHNGVVSRTLGCIVRVRTDFNQLFLGLYRAIGCPAARCRRILHGVHSRFMIHLALRKCWCL